MRHSKVRFETEAGVAMLQYCSPNYVQQHVSLPNLTAGAANVRMHADRVSLVQECIQHCFACLTSAGPVGCRAGSSCMLLLSLCLALALEGSIQ